MATFIPSEDKYDAWETAAESSYSALSDNWLHANHATVSTIRSSAGIAFDGVTIPPGSTILTAKLRVYPVAGAPDANLLIYGQPGHANHFDVATGGERVIPRTRTSASVAWVESALPQEMRDSPDITSVVQEIVNSAGWYDGATMAILLDGANTAPSGGSAFWFASRFAASLYWPELVVTWDPPVVPEPAWIPPEVRRPPPHVLGPGPRVAGAIASTPLIPLPDPDPEPASYVDASMRARPAISPPRPTPPWFYRPPEMPPIDPPVEAEGDVAALIAPLRPRPAPRPALPASLRLGSVPQSLVSVADPPVSCPGSALVVHAGPGAALVELSAAGGQGGSLAALVELVGPGSAEIEIC